MSLDLFTAVRARLADEQHWCQEASARDAQGERCDPLDASAVAWDVRGAIIREMGIYDPMRLENPLLALYYARPVIAGVPHEPSVTGTNDRLTHAQVVAWVDAVLARYAVPVPA